MDIKLIIFDLGGVIVNYTEQDYYRALSKKFNIPYKRIFDVFEPLIKQEESGKIKQEELSRRVKISLNIRSDIMWVEQFRKIARTNKDMIKLVKKLHSNYKIALLTNISFSRYSTATKYFINKDNFDIRVVSCYVKTRKPELKIYKCALTKSGFKADESLFIDNLKENIIGARKLGINGIVFKNYTKLLKELKKYNIKLEK